MAALAAAVPARCRGAARGGRGARRAARRCRAARASTRAEDPLATVGPYFVAGASVFIAEFWRRGLAERARIQKYLEESGFDKAKSITRIGALRFLEEKTLANKGRVPKDALDKVLGYQSIWDSASGKAQIKMKK